MQITGTKALVTGANRGLGKAFAEALLARGATTVYASARNPDRIDIPGVVPLQLDITDPASIEAAAAEVTSAAAPEIETVEIKPKRSGVDVRLVALAWIPDSATSAARSSK